MATSLLQAIGLRDSPDPVPNYAAGLIIWNFIFSYAIMSSRSEKRIYGFDHNASPRYDISTYGEALVKKGKISRATLDRIKRKESAHANCVEHFPFFVGTMLFAMHAGLPASTVNWIGVVYSALRITYGIEYTYIADERLSLVRALTWWASNIVCFYGLVQSGRKINGSI